MKGNPTIKERRFLEKYLQGKSLAECAKYAGSSGIGKHSLSQIGYEMLTRLDISMEETLNLSGITDQVLSEKVNEGLEAKKRYYGSWQGNIIKSEPFEDIPSRLKAVEIAGRMKGIFIDRHELTGANQGDIILQINSPKARRGSKSIKLDVD